MIRLSGPQTVKIAGRIFTSEAAESVAGASRPTAFLGRLHIELGSSLPCRLLLWPTQRSYTREPLAEFHTIGSPPLLDEALQQVCRAGARLAEPGEFTLRAFLAGRIDLAQAEAVLGVIDAHSQKQLDDALAQLAGGLSRPLNTLREDLIQLLAEIEAGLDFVDEDIEFISSEEIELRISRVSQQVERLEKQLDERSDESLLHQVVLLGPPNAGKSSLFNALVQRCSKADSPSHPQAIVASSEGTTRDYLVAELEIQDMQCRLVDTAGLDANINDSDLASIVQQMAQTQTQQQREKSTLRLYCAAADSPWRPAETGVDDILVVTKADLADEQTLSAGSVVRTSVLTGQGIDLLASRIAKRLREHSSLSSGVASTTTRCRESLRLSISALRKAISLVQQEAGDELTAAELRVALAELGKVVGAVYTDDILDRVFSSFCIGK